MTEIRRQEGQETLGILMRPIPVHQSARCKSVSQIMQAWSVTVGRTAQTDLPGQHIEGAVDLSTVQPISPAGDKQVGGYRPPCPMALASGNVVCEHLAGRGVQWYQASLTELGAADRQHRGLEIDILKLEVARFAKPQARDAQHSPNRQW